MAKTNNGKIKAKEFIKTYKLSEYTSEKLKEIVEEKGYVVAEFGNCPESETLISELNLKKCAANSRGFTYADNNYRIVFIDEKLSEEEKRIVFVHEIGHIFCGHFSKSPVIGNDVIEEYEANEFTHYVLTPSAADKIKSAVMRIKIKAILGILSLIIIAVISISAIKIHTERKYYGEYYVTASGTKYHAVDCRIVKDKTNKKRLTNEDFENGKYEPCEICLPQK